MEEGKSFVLNVSNLTLLYVPSFLFNGIIYIAATLNDVTRHPLFLSLFHVFRFFGGVIMIHSGEVCIYENLGISFFCRENRAQEEVRRE